MRDQNSLVIIGTINASDKNAPAMHMLSLAKQLARSGLAISLVIPKYEGELLLEVNEPGITLVKTKKLNIPKIPNSLSALLQIPSLWRLRKIGKVYIRTGPLSFLLTLAARAFGYKKIVLEVNGWLADELKALNMPWVLTALYEKIQVFELKRASSVRVVTTGLKNIILAANIEEDKVHIIENGTDIDLFTPLDQVMCRQELNLKPDIRYLVFVGNLARWQDLPTAFKAMPALLEAGYDVEMLILGEGREMDRFIAKAKQYGLEEKVHFLGKKSPETVNKYLSASDIGLAPFTSQRNKRIGLSPLKVRDYAAGGLPVASTLLPGLEQLKNETWIHLAEPENAEGFARALMKQLEGDSKAQGRLARAYAEKNFSWEKVIANIRKLFA